MSIKLISKKKCPCGDAHCSVWFLEGIGSFYQGSGFTSDEADEIIRAVNSLRHLRALVKGLHKDVTASMNGGSDDQ